MSTKYLISFIKGLFLGIFFGILLTLLKLPYMSVSLVSAFCAIPLIITTDKLRLMKLNPKNGPEVEQYLKSKITFYSGVVFGNMAYLIFILFKTVS